MSEAIPSRPVRKRAGPTRRFERRREEIVAIASDLINLHGTAGLTFAAVARALELDTSSIVYYFRKREQLAAACFARTLDHIERTAARAAREPTPRARARFYLRASFELFRQQRPAGARRLAVLSDLRALDEETRAPLDEQYVRIFITLRDMFDHTPDQDRRGVSAHVLLANAFWLFGWLDRFLDADIDRVFDRFCDILERGLAPTAIGWRAAPIALSEPRGDNETLDRFLHAATNLINAQGYRGASVEKIAAALGVTIGSFYHHLDNKDDLVAACCERSFALFEAAQLAADAVAGTAGERLASLLGALLSHQFTAASPLLRNTAFHTLPPELRQQMYDRADREAMHIAGLIADGHADGSVRAVDPFVASQIIMATVNAAVDLRNWAARLEAIPAPSLYSDSIIHGLFGALP